MDPSSGPSTRQEIEMDHLVGPQEVVADQVVNPADGGRHIRTLDNLKSEICLPRGNTPSERNAKLKCPKVPKSLLPSDAMGSESDGHRNEPKIMSLGPYHHGNPKLARGERIKLNLAEHAFLLFSMPGSSLIEEVDELYGKISGEVQWLRRCYDRKSTENYSDEEFSVMMMVDGCALLYYMFQACYGDEHDQENSGIRYQDLSHLQRDALLLENQLPYKLLLELGNKVPGYDTSKWMALCLEFVGVIGEEKEEEAYSFPQKMRKFCSGPFPAIGQIIGRQRRPNPDEESVINPNEKSEPHHLLDLYLKHWLGAKRPSQRKSGGGESVGYVKEKVMASFRNVKELMAAGIRIKPSPTRYLRDISFTSNVITGCLRLPIITIDNSTNDLFFNLIAWERCSSRRHDFISYLCFLDSLIDHADDVKELQSAGVLQNNLGTHEQVAEFFNTVSAEFGSSFHAYRDVRVKIRKHLKSHRNSKLKRWMTQCLDTYFGSPWTIIAWVGAALVLFFTAVQTYFSAFSH